MWGSKETESAETGIDEFQVSGTRTEATVPCCGLGS